MEREIFLFFLIAVFVAAPVTFFTLLFITAPYGRHARAGWGSEMNTRLGWIVMEAPACVVFTLFYFAGPRAFDIVPLVLFALWQLHYVDRSFLYPFRIRSGRRQTAVAMVVSGFVFNCINGFLNGSSLTAHGPVYEDSWLLDPRFVLGTIAFLMGLGINRWADSTLRNLRRPGETAYRIPRGGFYELISCPNYFGETLQWLGWAVATWSLAGLSFALFTAANLLPRAIAHHRWYEEQFPDYPPQRRAMIPFLW